MKTSISKVAVTLIATALLASCGGDDGGGSRPGGTGSAVADSCTVMTGGGTSTLFANSGCTGCAVENVARAIDNDLTSAATLRIPALSVGSTTLRATAQSGIVYPAGNIAAAVLDLGPADARIHLKTYLAGTLQDDGSATGDTTIRQNGVLTLALRTTKTFDAVEFVIDAETGRSSEETAQLRGFCSHSNAPTL